MDSSRNKTPCKNSTYGCTFATSSLVDMVRHFQCDCTFHPVRCFKCNKTVRKVNFAKHYAQFCQDSSAPPCPAPEEAPDVNEAKASATTVSQEEHFLRECVKDCTSSMESLSRVMNHVAEDVKEMKEKQQDLEATVKGQGDVIEKLGKSITMVAEKVNKLEQGVGTIVQRIEKVDGLVEDVSEIKRGIADQSRVHWYVENVSHYIEKAKTGLSYVKSDVFVIRGYSAKLRFEVEECGTTLWIGLHLHLCRGPNDSLLQWPFRIPYTLSLRHPTDASKTKEDKVTLREDFFFGLFLLDIGFEKPKNEEDEGYGTSMLCTVEEAQDEGFIEDDAVCVSVTLHG